MKHELESIFWECRRCGMCCKKFNKILLMPDEVDFIKKMGGHVGVNVKLSDLTNKTMDELVEEAKGKDDIFMFFPDENGCTFLEKDGKYFKCSIHNYRPKVCRGFKCNIADNSLMQLIFKDGFFSSI